MATVSTLYFAEEEEKKYIYDNFDSSQPCNNFNALMKFNEPFKVQREKHHS